MKHIQKMLVAVAVLVSAGFIVHTAQAEWPYNNNVYYNNSDQTISLQSNNITLSVGQSQAVTVSSVSPVNFSITNTSNSSVATAYINGNTITVQAHAPGSSTFSICQNASIYNCVSLYTTVENNVYNYSYSNTYPSYQDQYQSSVLLSQVPYTGFSSNTNVILFVLAMAVWTAGVSYLLIRRKMVKDVQKKSA